MKKKLQIMSFFCTVFLLCASSSYAVEKNESDDNIKKSSISVIVHFRINEFNIDSVYMNNNEELGKLCDALNREQDLASIDSVIIISTSSPDGLEKSNRVLSMKRADAISNFILTKCPLVSESSIITKPMGEDWAGLRRLVDADSKVPNRGELLKVLDRDLTSGQKKWLIKIMGGGNVFKYLKVNTLPQLRASSTEVILYWKPKLVVEEKKPEAPKVLPIREEAKRTLAVEEPTKNIKMAVKTNLLYDAAGIANIAAEVTLDDKFSVDVPFMYSPYTIKNDYRMRVLALQPELRYWLGATLDGHFFGANVSVGWFNVSTNNEDRYQDNRATWGAGLSYGYLLSLTKNWGAEFTLSGGYANMSYDVFYNVKNGAAYKSDTKNYWGITKLGISLVYKFNLK